MAAEVTQLVLAVDSRQVQQASAELKKFGQAGTVAERQSKSLEQSTQTLRRAFLGLGAALSIREVVQYADGYQQVNARLKLVTSTAADFSRVQGELIQQAEQTRSSLTETIDLYSRVARATRDLNVADTDRLRFTEAINKALIVSGASGASAQAAIIQLGQALASGVVRGEEFNSISEQAPRILEGVAKSLGKTTGELRAMAAQGELTASVFFNAFLGSADGIDREFQRIPVTIGQALVVAESRLQQFIGGTSELTGAGRAVAATIDTLSANIDVLTAAAGGFASAKLAQVLIGVGVAAKANLAATAANIAAQKAQAAATIDAARAELVRAQAVQAAAVMDGVQAREKIASMQASQAAIVVARAETVATIQSTQATLASAQAQLAAAKAAGALSFAIAQRNAAEVTINAALARQVTLTTELAVLGRQQASVQAAIATATAAQTAATTAQATAANAAARAQTGLNTAYTAAAGASSVASRAIGLLGGPIGIITTLLGLGASAWILWGNSAEEAADKAANGVDKALRKMVAADVQRLNEVNAELSKFQGGNNSANDAASIRFLTEKRKALQASIDEGRKTLDDQQRQQDGQDMLSRNYKPRRTIAEVVDTSTVSGINNRIKALKDLRDAAKIDSAEFQRYEKEIDSLEKKLQEIGVKKGPKAKEDKPDVLGFDLAKVRRDLDGVTNAFSIAESIMEAQRQAGALGDREYYSAKVSFIEMGRDAQIRALEVENKRLETERGNNTERLNNQKQIADNEARMAILRAQAAGQITVLGIQQDQALNATAKAFKDAELAAQDYLATLVQTQQRELSARGMGSGERDRIRGLQQIEDRYTKQRVDIERQRSEAATRAGSSGLSDVQQKQFDDLLRLNSEYQAKALSSYDDYYARRKEQDGSYLVGVNESLANYLDETANIAKQTEEAFSRAFQGMEDALVNFVKSGKLDFKSLADSIITDLARIAAKRAISGLLDMFLGASGGGSSASSGTNYSLSSGGGSWQGLKVNANGNVFGGAAGLSKYSGQVVNKPTLFPFARGAGLMGEAGEEGIFPLKRGKDGKLGVSAEGSGNGPITIKLVNESGTALQASGQRQSTMPDGTQLIEVFLAAAGEALANRSGPIARGYEAGYGSGV